MWNGMRFHINVKTNDFHTLDPVAWSLSAWVSVQCFKHFKGFLSVWRLWKSPNWQFLIRPNFTFRRSLAIKLYLLAKNRQIWRFLANLRPQEPEQGRSWTLVKLAILKIANFGDLVPAALRTENRRFSKPAIFGVTEVGRSGGACWRRRLEMVKIRNFKNLKFGQIGLYAPKIFKFWKFSRASRCRVWCYAARTDKNLKIFKNFWILAILSLKLKIAKKYWLESLLSV